MKIGFLIDSLSSGGAQRTTVSLANSFVRQGENVEIITFVNDKSLYPIDENVSVISLDFDTINTKVSVSRMKGSFDRMFKLRKLIASRKLDVLIGMSYSMTWYAVYACEMTNTKVIGTERNNPYVYSASKFNTILRKTFYHFTDGFVFQTEKAANFFRKKSDGDIVIPNAIFNESIYTISPVSQRQKFICGVGRLTRQKRFDVLIDAFAIINKTHPDYRLIIFGEGEDRKSLEKQAKKLGISDRVLLPGATDEVIKLLNYASVFVLSSEMEGMPNALMEAMALGIPCVSTKCDMGPGELIVSGENGILTKVNSPKKIAEAVNEIIENPDFAQRLSKNAKKILETHSIDKISSQWLEYIKKTVRE